MPLRLVDTDDLNSEDKSIPSILQFESAAGRFRLKQIVNNSSILISSAEDGDIPDALMVELQDNIRLDGVNDRNYDAGSF